MGAGEARPARPIDIRLCWISRGAIGSPILGASLQRDAYTHCIPAV